MSTTDVHSRMPALEARRIVLVNPTKFLGNLLLSGGLIQQLCRWCLQHDKQLMLVLDESFSALVADAFPGARVVFYPRRALLPGAPWFARVRTFWRCLSAIRNFKADLAFTIEEDSVSHRLAHLSGAAFKVSSTVHRYHIGFDQVLDIPRSGRKKEEASIWFSLRDIFHALGIPVQGTPDYLRLHPVAPDNVLRQRLRLLGVMDGTPLLLMHAGASKTYKQWPVRHFAQLALIAIKSGYQPCLIGAGRSDQTINRQLIDTAESLANGTCNSGNLEQHSGAGSRCVDLCDQLGLAELASLMTISSAMVGNDSGPSHLASALGLPGVVIFGPTDLDIWQPLAATTYVSEKKALCGADCSRHHCRYAYRCLEQITPDEVAGHLNLNTN